MDVRPLLLRMPPARSIHCLFCKRQVHSEKKRNGSWGSSISYKDGDPCPLAKHPVDDLPGFRDPLGMQVKDVHINMKPWFAKQVQGELDRPPAGKGKSPAAMERARKKAAARIRAWENGPPSPQGIERKIPKDVYVPILLEKEDFVCINKPPNVLSQPGLPGEGTILDLLRFQRRGLPLQTVNRYAPKRSNTNF